jgi:hypothetical protein
MEVSVPETSSSKSSGIFVSTRSLLLGLALGGMLVAAAQTASAQIRTFGTTMIRPRATTVSVTWVSGTSVHGSSASATCPTGTVVIGGGGGATSGIYDEGPDTTKNQWVVDTIAGQSVPPYTSAIAACMTL